MSPESVLPFGTFFSQLLVSGGLLRLYHRSRVWSLGLLPGNAGPNLTAIPPQVLGCLESELRWGWLQGLTDTSPPRLLTARPSPFRGLCSNTQVMAIHCTCQAGVLIDWTCPSPQPSRQVPHLSFSLKGLWTPWEPSPYPPWPISEALRRGRG